MKTPKPKTCKECNNKFIPLRPLQSVCDYKCAHERTRKREQKRVEWARVQQRKQDVEKLMTLTDWLNVAQKVVNTYVRLRDADLPCVSCNATQAKWSAGHFHSQGGHSFLRFHEDNLHKQCVRCNLELHSNPHEYRERLTLKIGAGRVEYLDKHRNAPRKYSIDEVKELITEYRMKIKQLKTTI